MAVTIWQDDNYYGYSGYFPDHARTPDLSNYAIGYTGDYWGDDISSLYTSTTLIVYEGDNYTGDYAVLAPGYHDLASLASYGIENDDIDSFYAFPPV